MNTTLKRAVSFFLVMSLSLSFSLAEELGLESFNMYQSSKGYVLNEDTMIDASYYGTKTIGKLNVHGKDLTQVENGSVMSFISHNNNSVQFSLVELKDYTTPTDNVYVRQIVKESTKRIDEYDWKEKIGKGGLLVQRSYDGIEWETVYTKTNVFSEYHKTIDNFYSASRADLEIGSYYRIVLAYRTKMKTKNKKIIGVFDNSTYEDLWNVEEYTVFLMSDGDTVSPKLDDVSVSRPEELEVNEGKTGAVLRIKPYRIEWRASNRLLFKRNHMDMQRKQRTSKHIL